MSQNVKCARRLSHRRQCDELSATICDILCPVLSSQVTDLYSHGAKHEHSLCNVTCDKDIAGLASQEDALRYTGV